MAGVAPLLVDASKKNVLSGTIRWEVDKDSFTNTSIFSPAIKVGGMRWEMLLQLTEDRDYIGIYLYRKDDDDKIRSADVQFENKLINHDDDAKTISVKLEKTISIKKIRSWGRFKFVKKEEAIDEAKGFIKDNQLTFQIQFTLSNIIELRIRRINFTDPNEPSHDIALLIGTEKYYTSKSYLSILSPVFHAMFYGNFAEKSQNEIELKDVDHKEFCEMMKVIYPPHKKITDDNFEYLLKLGDRFEINTVIDLCELFLINSSSVNAAKKLVLADHYRLLKLQDHCIDQLKTIKEVTDLRNLNESKNFSDAIKAALFEKINELAE